MAGSPTARRISVVVEGNSASGKKALAEFGAALDKLGKDLQKQASAALDFDKRIIASNDAVISSSRGLAEAVTSSSRSVIASYGEMEGTINSTAANVVRASDEQVTAARSGATAFDDAVASQIKSLERLDASVNASADAIVRAAEKQASAMDAAAGQQIATQRRLTSEVQSNAAKQKAAFDLTGTGMAKLGKATTLGALGVGAASIYMAAKYEAANTRLKTQADATEKQVKQISHSLLNMAGEVGQSPEHLSQSMFHVVSAMNAILPPAHRTAEELQIQKVAAEGAAVGHTQLEETTYALSSAMNALHVNASQAQKTMGTLNAIVGAGDMTMEDLLGALKSGLIPTSRAFGISLESVGSALAVMGDQGMRGAMAGTRLRMSIALLAAPSEKAAEMLKAIGLSSGEIHAKTTAMSEALQQAGLSTTKLAEDVRKPNGVAIAFKDLDSHLRASGLSATESAALMSRAFGGGRMGATIQLLSQSADRVDTKYKQIVHTSDNFGKAWETTQKTVAQQAKELGGSVQSLGVEIGDALIPKAEELVGTLKEVVMWLKHGGTEAKALEYTVGGVLATAVGVYAVGSFVKFIHSIQSAGMEYKKLQNYMRSGFSSTAPRTVEEGIARGGVGGATTTTALSPVGGIWGANGPEAPGSRANPIIVAVEAGEFAGLGGQAAAGEASASRTTVVPKTSVGTTEPRAGGVTTSTVAAEPVNTGIPAYGGGRLLRDPVTGRMVGKQTYLPSEIYSAANPESLMPVEEQIAKGGMMTAVRGFMGTMMGNLMSAGMVGGLGYIGAQAVGGAVGGKTGKDISKFGGDAALGAAIGTAIEPGIGTAIGGGLGLIAGGIKSLITTTSSEAQSHTEKLFGGKGKPGLMDTADAKAAKEDREKELKQLGALRHSYEIRGGNRAGQTGSYMTNPKRAKEIEDYYQEQQGSHLGKAESQYVLKGTKNPGIESIIETSKRDLAQLKPAGRAAFIEMMKEMVNTLEKEGRLPKGAIKKFVGDLKPELQGLPNLGAKSSKDFVNEFLQNLNTQSMLNDVSNAAQQINSAWAREYGLLPITTHMTMEEVEHNANHDLGFLQNMMKNGTKQQREEAEKEYALLAPALNKYMGQASKAVENELKAISHHAGPLSQEALSKINQAWDALPPSLKKTIEKAGGEVTKGLDKMDKQVNSELKTLGVEARTGKNEKGETIKSGPHGHTGAAQGALYQLGRKGQAGLDSIPIHMAGMNIMAAPGEKAAIITRHQEAFLNQRTADVGGLAGVFTKFRTPHHMAEGGFVPGQAYAGLTRGRIDQGVDFGGSGPVRAVGPGSVKSVGLWPGWPGTGGVVYSTPRGMVYVMEDFAPSVHAGQALRAGQIIGRATGGSSGIETGWANSSGTAPIVRYGSAPDGTPMSGGKSFSRFLGGGSGRGAAAEAIWRAIATPHIGAGGQIGEAAQAILNKAGKALNRYGSEKASAAGGGGGASFGAHPASALPSAARARLMRIASERHWSANDWLAVIGLESGGDPAAKNASGAYGIGQALGATQREFPKMVSSNPAVQIEGMAEYIASQYHNPTAALAHEHADHWYNLGGWVLAASGVSPKASAATTKKPPANANAKIQRQKSPKTKLKPTGKSTLDKKLGALKYIPGLEQIPGALAPYAQQLEAFANLSTLLGSMEGGRKIPVLLQSDMAYLPGLAAAGLHSGMPVVDAYSFYEQWATKHENDPQAQYEGEYLRWAESQADHKLLTEGQAGILAPAAKEAHLPGFKSGQPIMQIQEAIKEAEIGLLGGGAGTIKAGGGELRAIRDVAGTLQAAVNERKRREHHLEKLKAIQTRRAARLKRDMARLATASLKDKLAAARDGVAQTERIVDAEEHKAAVAEARAELENIPSKSRSAADKAQINAFKGQEEDIANQIRHMRDPIKGKTEAVQRAELGVLKDKLKNELTPINESLKIIDGSEGGISIKGLLSEIKTISKAGEEAQNEEGVIAGTKIPTAQINLEEIVQGLVESGIPLKQVGTTETNTALLSALEAQREEQAKLLAAVNMQFATIANFEANLPRFEQGGPVLKDGPIYAHKDEWVVPRGGALVSGAGAPSPNVNLHHQTIVAMDMDRLIRVIDSRITHPTNVRANSRQMQRRVQGLPAFARTSQ